MPFCPACLRPEQLDALDALLITEPNKGITPLTWLKAIPTAVKPDHVRDILDRLCQVREIGIPAKLSTLVHPDRYRQFVREGRASPAYLIERYTASRRQATLVACLIDLEERLTDAAIEMADKLIGKFAQRLKRNKLDGVRLVEDRLQISPVKTTTPPMPKRSPTGSMP